MIENQKFMGFGEWQEKKSLEDLRNELRKAIDGKHYIYTPEYHEELVKKLRIAGMGEDADELELIRPSEEDKDFWRAKPNSPQNKNILSSWNSAKLASDTYEKNIEHILAKVEERLRG